MSLGLVQSHLDGLIESGTDRYGPDHTPMWMSALDLRTRTYPTQSAPVAGFTPDPSAPVSPGTRMLPGRRAYRNIDAPRGCSLYWDQPQIAAAHALTALTGDSRYSAAADAYTECFLERCVAPGGIFLWGNHYYYDAFIDGVRWFKGNEEPVLCEMDSETGWLHEMRPIRPAWGSFWRINPQAAEREIRTASRAHLFDEESGGFNRHADRARSHAFLEAGGILVESLCWLAEQAPDDEAESQAHRIAEYSFAHRGKETGLLENNPTSNRWEKVTATS